MKSTFRLLSGSVLVSVLAATVVACSDGDSVASSEAAPDPAAQSASGLSAPVSGWSGGGERNAYFGDLHVHTTYSMDAFQFGTLATPDDAYRYARGEAIKHPWLEKWREGLERIRTMQRVRRAIRSRQRKETLQSWLRFFRPWRRGDS